MNESNPYVTPAANLEQTGPQNYVLTAPKSVAAGRAWGWINEGYGHFRKNPGSWILTFIAFAVIYVLMSLIPFLGQIAVMLTYLVWTAGFMIGCRAQDEGQPFTIRHLFAGFKKPGKLMLLSVILSVISLLIMLIAVGPIYLEFLKGGSEPSPEVIEAISDPTGFWLPYLVAMLILIPWFMAMWFAPALIALHDVSIVSALKLSFKGCLKNIVPMFLYGVIGFILMVVGSIPLMIGLLIVIPILIASVYVSYKDIFTEAV